MRLIDADALIEEALTDGACGYIDALQIAIAPTVDAVPVRHGRWVHTDLASHWHGKDECSECTYHEQDRSDLPVLDTVLIAVQKWIWMRYNERMENI